MIKNKKKILEFVVYDWSFLSHLLCMWGKFKRWSFQFIPGKVIEVNIHDLYCKPYGFRKYVLLNQSPHYKHCRDGYSYNNYLLKHGVMAGYPTHSTAEKYEKFIKEMDYLGPKHRLQHILVAEFGTYHKILDGKHRASVLLHRINSDTSKPLQDVDKIKVRLVNKFWRRFIIK